MSNNELVIIDGYAYLYRSFFAIKSLSTKGGFPTNAIYGFVKLVNRIVKEKSPKYIAVAFDSIEKTFRKEAYDSYKAQRPPMPADLSVQIPIVKKIIAAMGISYIVKDGYEADDIIYSAAKNWEGPVLIVTGDKDLMQCVDSRVSVWNISSDKIYTPDEVKKKFAVFPDKIAMFLALVGDNADNIPGIPGIGPKRAAFLLNEFGSVDNIYNNMEKLPKRIRDSLAENKKQLADALFLTEIKDDIQIDRELFTKGESDLNALSEIYKQLEFKGFLLGLYDDKNINKNFITYNQFLSELGDDDALAVEIKDETVLLSADNGTVCSLNISEEFRNVIKGREIVVNDSKQLLHITGVLENYFDLSIASYLIDNTKKGSLSWLSFNLTGNPKPEITDYFELKKLALERLKNDGLTFLYDIEQKLSTVLFNMEKRGIKVDRDLLYQKRKELEKEIFDISDAIFKLSDYKLNLNSPKQISELLFDKIGLKPIKRGKIGLSTDIETLNKLADKHPIVPLIIKYRSIEKLQTTYIDPLIKLSDNPDWRIHTTYNQKLTATGRLSSSEPNLQNIPTDAADKHSIRDVFVAKDGFKFISSDYSQMELRVMAAVSGDKELISAFQNGEDIHTSTAAKLFDTPIKIITKAQRRLAKVINFGIMYGMGINSLAKNLAVSRVTAENYYNKYFEKYNGVKQYMENMKLFARRHGYVETFFKRRRLIAEINSLNPRIRSFGERAAINAPIQGTSADIIKIAMIKLYNRLKEQVKADILLQIHDELIVEVAENDVAKAAVIIKEVMENAVEFEVKMLVDMKVGNDWLHLKQIDLVD